MKKGSTVSLEAREKISEAMRALHASGKAGGFKKGHETSAETRQKIRLSMQEQYEKNPQRGFETGRIVSSEVARKISESNKGREAWNKGIPQAEEAKRKHSESQTGHTHTPKNEAHWNWQGDNARYSAVHKWMTRHFGSPRLCELCKTTQAKKYEWANIDHSYRRVREEWMRVCTSCHRKHDAQLRSN